MPHLKIHLPGAMSSESKYILKTAVSKGPSIQEPSKNISTKTSPGTTRDLFLIIAKTNFGEETTNVTQRVRTKRFRTKSPSRTKRTRAPKTKRPRRRTTVRFY